MAYRPRWQDMEWRPKLRPLCPAAQPEPDVCDCGYEGEWLMRHWTELQRCPPTYAELGSGSGRGFVVKQCHDCKRGGPGHDLIAGWEERCPRCGDVERFQWDGTLVEARRNPQWLGSRSHDLTAQLELFTEVEDEQ